MAGGIVYLVLIHSIHPASYPNLQEGITRATIPLIRQQRFADPESTLCLACLLLCRTLSSPLLGCVDRLLCVFLVIDPPKCRWWVTCRGSCVGIGKPEYEAGCTTRSAHILRPVLDGESEGPRWRGFYTDAETTYAGLIFEQGNPVSGLSRMVCSISAFS